MGTAAIDGQVQSLGRQETYMWKLWAPIGVAFILFEGYTWFNWFTGPFAPTDPGPDPISDGYLTLIRVWEITFLTLWAVTIWYWIIKPWRQEGHMTTNVMLAIVTNAIIFFDPTYNYASTSLFYNSHFVNWGSWTNNAMPGWMSTNGHLLPEPVLVSVPAYLIAVFGQAVFVNWLLRRLYANKQEPSVLQTVMTIVIGLTIVDTLVEMVFIHGGVYVYPGAISWLTLFPGEWYQFPLTEGLFFGGLSVGTVCCLMYFKDDNGETFADRGLQKMKYRHAKKQWIKFLSLFGVVHLAFFMFYTVPQSWVALHTDSFPENYRDFDGWPSWWVNGTCNYGVDGDECPGPGVLMPRRDPPIWP